MKATIDRIEGALVTLISNEEKPVTFTLPRNFIGSAGEGDIVEIEVNVDSTETNAAKERVTSLFEKLKKKSDPAG